MVSHASVVLAVISCFSGCVLSDNLELLLVQGIFRHGERQTEYVYPNDPNINNTFYPAGKGGLTNDGKMQMYKLGLFLRQRYGEFLGDVYTDKLLSVRSTGFARTRMSAQLVLAGLWPPSQIQLWNEKLPWIPIPVDYKPYEEEDLLNPGNCAKIRKLLEIQPDIPEVNDLYIKPYEKMMEFLATKTGSPMRSPKNLLDLYFILKTEIDQNFPVPEWTKEVYPEPLEKAASTVYSYFNYNPELRRINAGYLLQRLLNEIDQKINDVKSAKKMLLFSGHDTTLGQLLNVIFKEDGRIPPYASVILFELLRDKEKQEHFIKVLYRRGDEELVTINLADCYLCNPSLVETRFKDVLPSIPYIDACVDKKV